MNKLYIGVSGLARSGKDLCGKIAMNYLKKYGRSPLRVALADELKMEAEEFLNIVCDTTPYTEDSEEKTRIRPFLVWLGCYKRIKQPDYWIQQAEKTIHLNNVFDSFVITDIRFENEAHWIHSKGGFLIHVKKYTKESPDGGRTWNRIYQKPPNTEEETNDPLVQKLADYHIEWEDLSNNGNIKISVDELVYNTYLKEEVYKCLQVCPGLSTMLKTP